MYAISSPATRTPSADSDDELIRRVRAGDQAAFERLVVRHHSKLLKVALRITGNQSDAEDVAQDALLHAYRGFTTFSGKSSFSTWLCQIAVNVALMRRRAARCRPGPLFVGTSQATQSHEAHGALGDEFCPPAEVQLDRLRLVRELERALTPLDEGSRAIFAMRALDGASTQEVADSLRMSPMAVRQRLHRVRLSIRQKLAPLLESA